MPLALLQQSLQRPQPSFVPLASSPPAAQRDLRAASPVAALWSNAGVSPMRVRASSPVLVPAAGCGMGASRGHVLSSPSDARAQVLPNTSPMRSQVMAPWALSSGAPVLDSRKQVWETQHMHNYNDINSVIRKGPGAVTAQTQASDPDLLNAPKSPQKATRNATTAQGEVGTNHAKQQDWRAFKLYRANILEAMFHKSAGRYAPPQGGEAMRMDVLEERKADVRLSQAGSHIDLGRTMDIDGSVAVKRAPGLFPQRCTFGPAGQPPSLATLQLLPKSLEFDALVGSSSPAGPSSEPKQRQLSSDLKDLRAAPATRSPLSPHGRAWRPGEQVGRGLQKAAPQEAASQRPQTPPRSALAEDRGSSTGAYPASAAAPSGSSAALPFGTEKGREELAVQISKLGASLGVEEIVNIYRSKSFEPLSASAPPAHSPVDIHGRPSHKTLRARPSGKAASPDAAAGAPSCWDDAVEGSALSVPWEKASIQSATKKREIAKRPATDWIKAETHSDPNTEPQSDHLQQVLNFLASDAKARTEASPMHARESLPAGNVTPPRYRSSKRLAEARSASPSPSPSMTCRSSAPLIGATIAQLSQGGAPRQEHDEPNHLGKGETWTAWNSRGARDIDFTPKRGLGEYSREDAARPPSLSRSASPDYSRGVDRRSRGSLRKAADGTPTGSKSPKVMSRSSPSPSSSSRCVRSSTPTESWRDIGIFGSDEPRCQAPTRRSLTPTQPMRRSRSEMLLSFQESQDEPPNGLGMLGHDSFRPQKPDIWKRWNDTSINGLDIDRSFKRRSGEFSPHFCGSRSSGRGSRSPQASRDPSRAPDSSQNPVAPSGENAIGDAVAADTARGISGNRARRSSRSPSTNPRKAWRQEREVSGHDVALLCRNPYMPRTSSPSLRPNLFAHGNDATSSSSATASAFNLSAFADSLNVTSTVAESMLDVSSSASTAAVRPLPEPFPSPPSKNRTGAAARGVDRTSVSSPQARERSSPNPGSRRSMGRLAQKSAGGPASDFWG